tara:strand:+ start:4131 stop:4805 length:675 start_codon:yes stop_codon:yes gene_type:complete
MLACILLNNSKHNKINYLKQYILSLNPSYFLIVQSFDEEFDDDQTFDRFKTKLHEISKEYKKIIIFSSGSDFDIDVLSLLVTQRMSFLTNIFKLVQTKPFNNVLLITICFSSQVILNYLKVKYSKNPRCEGFIYLTPCNNKKAKIQTVYADFKYHFDIESYNLKNNKQFLIKPLLCLTNKKMHKKGVQNTQLFKINKNVYSFAFHPESLLSTHELMNKIIKNYF